MIYMFLADGFEEIEALATLDIIRRAELDIKTVGIGSDVIQGSHAIKVFADMQIKDISTDDMEMIILPGGIPGTLNLEAEPLLKTVVDYCARNDKFICAICAAPSILGHMNLLKGKNVTCYPGFDTQLNGANYTGENVSVDGKIITAKGAGVSIDFALKIVELFDSKEKANKLFCAMQCKN